MKENKEQLRSAEEILDKHVHYTQRIYRRTAIDAMEEFASQFKPSGVKTFTVEDMKEAFEAGRSHESEKQFGTFSRFQKTKFDEWIKTRKP